MQNVSFHDLISVNNQSEQCRRGVKFSTFVVLESFLCSVENIELVFTERGYLITFKCSYGSNREQVNG